MSKPKAILLPKFTREMALEDAPDLAWTREDTDTIPTSREGAQRLLDYGYEGRSTE